MASFKHAPRSIITVVIVTIIALAFGWFAGSAGTQWNGLPVFFICTLIAFLVNWGVFIPSAIAKSERFFDLVGAITYLSMLAAACILSAPLDPRSVIVAAMVAIWCTRLGTFLFKRISDAGDDKRFDKIRGNPPRFLVAWTLQALWCILTAAAALAVITSTERVALDWFFWIGGLIWLFGFAFEVIADRQKSAFKKDPANEGDFIDCGLWAWSQHPNYFGEIVLWGGILVMAIPVLSGWSWLAVISPFFVAFLLTKVSGIPMLDEAAEKRWGDDPAYQAYRKNTPVLIPRPPKS
ncbi:DUF1295 domain-containing protein [Altererythrobacter luteolus]|uniref:DUF1295 domain-containing protein n=1 Tax=Pontixanthobacter luteolus TaxID=295089 RepID=A0A6I4V270_9SPHN|nr:DUF1295 domain-containing protein [Pontixanthobacter luteolus]MXP46042.1 DUF1295 domain-containing protein [Pontixanthobacter luteolus]